ncbi:MAG: serine hydrolase [Thermomicrobium sp.]|nr:serine hydrolase [Thermomicrobium sp.]MDW7982834.1 serine hydrolase [Thermomicrobium sp.]
MQRWGQESFHEGHAIQRTDEPVLRARAAYVVDVTAGVELWARDADEPMPPASTIKMLTALTARRLLSLEERVVIRADDLVDPTVYANAGFRPGDRVRVHDLLAALLVASAGDAARALARVGGARLAPEAADPRRVFVSAMNAEARQLGLRGTRVLTPDGRDTPTQVTTARDLAMVAARLLSDPVLAKLVATPTVEIGIEGAAARKGRLWNTNRLLGEPGVLGVKTGTSTAAGECLVTAVRRGNNVVILVVLGSVDRYAETRTLLDWLDRHYRWVTVDGRTFPELAALWRLGVVPAIVPTLLLTAAQAERLEMEIEITDRAGARRIVGTVRLRTGTVGLVVVPLVRSDPRRLAPE